MPQSRGNSSVKIERGVREGCCISHILFKLHGEYLMKGPLAQVRNFKIVGRIINKVKFVDMAIISQSSWRGTRYGEQIGLDWKEVWHGYQYRQITSNKSIQE